jgi:23S rRNA (cytidine1920-2'-O)/16S rRNA (cytidine1409-2'-O)-methyltransferase
LSENRQHGSDDAAAGEFASRAGAKLAAALDAFGVDPAGRVCADFGCNVGGFTDCLLQRGAAKVYAVDTGYGTLAWRLRKSEKVVVMERTNALRTPPPEAVDLVTIDVAWTPQERIVPAAMKWLAGDAPCREPLADGRCVVSLLKPHYELAKLRRSAPRGPLSDEQSEDVCRTVRDRLGEIGWAVSGVTASPLRGKGGNREFLLLFRGQSSVDGPGSAK